MATSSIIENIRVNNPRVLEEYVAAMEEAAKKPLSKDDFRRSHVVSDPESINAFFKKALAKRSPISERHSL